MTNAHNGILEGQRNGNMNTSTEDLASGLTRMGRRMVSHCMIGIPNMARRSRATSQGIASQWWSLSRNGDFC